MRLLAAHGLRPDTDLGQHFLLDENLADLAVREAAVGPDDVAYEIGAGLGVLTAALARAARAVHAVEVDRRLEPALAEVVARSHNVVVHWADAMRMPVEDLDPPPTVMVSNLPYAIATPVVVESLWRLPRLERWCAMAQREVVQRWLAPHGSRLYGAPSVLLQLTAEPTFRRAVGREVFVPRPRVDSALVALRRVAPGPAPAVRSLVRAAFASRRKTLVNSLVAAGADKAAVAAAVAALGHPPSVRPEQIPPAGFPALAEALGWGGVTGVRISAPAKLNLRLLVGPPGDDGYHPLHTLMVALDGLADAVTVAVAAERRVTCPGIEGPRNLAWRALAELELEAGRPLPTAVVIDKRIPVQAGLGGGSSDAAAVLVAADRLYGLGLGPERLEGVAARVGSDVPFFVRGGAQWAEGRGERLRPASVAPFAAVLAKGAAGLSTAAVYAAFDRLPSSPAVVAGSSNHLSYAEVVAGSRNDLWGAALALAPGLGATARALAAAGADAVLLCGSGSSVAGLFPARADAETAAARLDLPGFRAVVEGPARPGSA